MTASICKKGVPKNFAKFTVKHHKGPQACNLSKRESGTGVFLRILRHFKNPFFHRIPLGGCF